jgi:hypothetical protein
MKNNSIDKTKIIEKNPKVDKALVKKHDRLESQLKKLGVETKPSFKIEPPLGGSRQHLYNS